jgi:Fe-S-cluster containining protein
MQLQVLDESVRFSCGSCTRCCDQPWRTLIEPDKAAALDAHDWSGYPQLTGRTLYTKPKGSSETLYELAKGEGTRCVFLDTDGLCIVHKELGAEAKPHMCRQFPYLPARTWVDDRISVNFGCPSVQDAHGVTLAEQRDEIAELVPLTTRDPKPDAPVAFDATLRLTPAENDALFERAVALFDPQTDEDLWTRFADLVALLAAVGDTKRNAQDDPSSDRLVTLLRSNERLPNTPDVPEIRAFEHPSQAPMPVRFLFAATLYPDTVPADATTRLGFGRRLTLIPKLFALARLSGGYASRLLGRNVSIDDVVEHEVADKLAPAGRDLLVRYFQSRLWQRFLAGTRLTVLAGIHQHICDLNAVVFLARAEALARGTTRLTEEIVHEALTRVEFHLANQSRLWDQTLKGWLRTQLRNPALAAASLRLMALKRPATIPTEQAGVAG